ncbi:MAG: hypothetical protein GY798_24655 [Hyphomicrobiales bacterium]|nr:hypothetical protein [Hyphomicrobiales bacterium]
MAMTTVELDDVIRVGNHQVAALVQRSGVRNGHRRSVNAWFTKRPLAILVADGKDIRAFDLSGAPLPLNKVDGLCPGAMEAFIRQARS